MSQPDVTIRAKHVEDGRMLVDTLRTAGGAWLRELDGQRP